MPNGSPIICLSTAEATVTAVASHLLWSSPQTHPLLLLLASKDALAMAAPRIKQPFMNYIRQKA